VIFEGQTIMVVPLSILGGVAALVYYREMTIMPFRIFYISVLLLILWWNGLTYFDDRLQMGRERTVVMMTWLGLVVLMYFIALGAINAWFGFWITIFNVFVLFVSLIDSHSANPVLWVSVLELASIENVYFQWGIVLVSAILGLAQVSDRLLEAVRSLWDL